jgi:hypothetical protein
LHVSSLDIYPESSFTDTKGLTRAIYCEPSTIAARIILNAEIALKVKKKKKDKYRLCLQGFRWMVYF